MTLVLDDAPTEKEVLWTCTGVEILCGEESVMVSEDDGKRESTLAIKRRRRKFKV